MERPAAGVEQAPQSVHDEQERTGDRHDGTHTSTLGPPRDDLACVGFRTTDEDPLVAQGMSRVLPVVILDSMAR